MHHMAQPHAIQHEVSAYINIYIYIYIYKERQRDRETERVNFVRMWCKTQILPLQSQHATLSYHIFMNKHNHTYT